MNCPRNVATFTKYWHIESKIDCMQELRDAISATQYKTITANELLIAAPEELIYLTICALLKPGDTCIVTFPGNGLPPPAHPTESCISLRCMF